MNRPDFYPPKNFPARTIRYDKRDLQSPPIDSWVKKRPQPTRPPTAPCKSGTAKTVELPETQGRLHWLLYVGLGMLAILFVWIGLSILSAWRQGYQDDYRYGNPRTFQTDARVGHNDAAIPSHFMVVNLNKHITVLEMQGGDASKVITYNGPTLLGQGQEKTPATLQFEDVNHDGKIDMLVIVGSARYVFLNDGKQPQSILIATQGPGKASILHPALMLVQLWNMTGPLWKGHDYRRGKNHGTTNAHSSGFPCASARGYSASGAAPGSVAGWSESERWRLS